MIVTNDSTNETMRVPLGAPKAKQWNTPKAAVQYLKSLVGIKDETQLLQDIRVNDVPIHEFKNLVSLRQQGGIMNITATLAESPQVHTHDVAQEAAVPMELEMTQIDDVRLRVEKEAARDEISVLSQQSQQHKQPVPPHLWIY